jgi:hypothetical protein
MSYAWRPAGIGVSLCAIGLIAITAIDGPPPLKSLTEETHLVDGPALLVRPGRGPTSAVVRAGGAELFIRNVCNDGDCRVPSLFAALKPNQKLVVWREDNTIWQARNDAGGEYTYQQAVTDANKASATSYLWYMGLLAAGLLAALLGGRSSAA